MLARKLSSLGSRRCPRPWRARNATLRSSSHPHTYASEGVLNGVFTRTSFTLLNPGMEYNPLPPMIPISACANPPPERLRIASQTRDYTGRELALPRRSMCRAGTPARLLAAARTRWQECPLHKDGPATDDTIWT